MIESKVPCYNDYSSLLVLALGFNLVYVVLRKSEDRKAFKEALFFLFLLSISSSEKTIEKIEKKIKTFRSKAVKLNFLNVYLKFLAVDKIIEIFGSKDGRQLVLHAIDSGESPYENLCKKLEQIAKIVAKISERFSSINNLHLLALITTVYSLYVVISAPYEQLLAIDFNFMLLNTNIIIIISGCFLVLLDLILKDRFRCIPICLFVLCLLFVVCTILGLLSIGEWILPDKLLYHNYWITALVCFSGFILYIISTIIGALILLICHLWILIVSFFPERKLIKIVKIVDAKVPNLDETIAESLKPAEVFQNIEIRN